MTLTPTIEKFILHWGEMGARWGINRTVAQIQALLYVSEEPLNAEQISELLGVARSNVSTSIRELINWGIVKNAPVMGDRKEYFTTITDVWQLFQIIIAERKKREIDPTTAILADCVDEADPGKEAYTRERLEELLDFINTMSACYEKFKGVPIGAMTSMVNMSDELGRFFGKKK